MSKISKYRIIEEIEAGNYTLVYRVNDGKNELILKIARECCPEFNEIIRREFQILSQFRHPNIVQVYEYDVSSDGRAFFTLEYISGKPINHSFKKFSEEFIEAVIQVINALGAFHNKGFIHGDLKPEHILYNRKEKKIVLIDFGFAGISTHQIKSYGTLGYVAPEVIKNIGMDQRSDLYSLGVIIYEILSGAGVKTPVRPLKNIPKPLNNTILKLLSEEPALRPTALELYDVFNEFLREKFVIPHYAVQLPPTGFVEVPEIMEKLLRLKGETVIIYGEVGAGKTRILKEMRYKYLFKNYDVFLYTGREEGYFYEFICNSINFNDLDFSKKEDRFQVYADITERLIEFAKDRNIIILVDDLHNLNDYELGLFRFIGHSLEDTHITMIATSNPDPRVRDLSFFELNLKPFTFDDMKRLIEKTFFEIETKDGSEIFLFVEWLHRYTGGNPLFIVETLKTLHSQGILMYYQNRWQIDMEALKKLHIPDSIEGTISARLKGLSDNELYILKILSIADYPLESSILSTVMPELTSISIEILKMVGLIKEEHISGNMVFSIANQIIKTLVERMIRKEERAMFITNIIRAIEYNQVKRDFYPLLGRLYREIGDEKRAFIYYLLAAEEMEKINDIRSALGYYTYTFECSKGLDNHIEVALKLGELYLLSGENEKAIEFYNRCIESPTKPGALFGLGKAYSNLGDFEKAILHLKKAMEETEEEVKQVEILNRLAYCYICLKDFVEGERILNRSIDISKKTESPKLEAEALYYYATLDWFKGDYNRGIKTCLELLDFCNGHNLDKQSAYTANLLSSFYLQVNDVENGLRYIEMAIRGFELMRDVNALVPAMLNKGMLIANSGDIKKAMLVFEKSLDYSLKTGSKRYQYICLTNIAGILEETNKFDKAIEYYNKALEIEPESTYANYPLSMVYYKLSEIDKAKSILEEKMAKKEDVLYFIGLGMVYSALGRIEKAKEYIETGLERIKKEGAEASIQREVYIKSCQLFYETGAFERALAIAEELKKIAIRGTRDYIIADAFIKINKFRLGLVDNLDIDAELKYLKERDFLYDYGYIKKCKIESIIDRGVEPERIKDIAGALESVEQIFKSISAELEFNRVQKLKLYIYPEVIRDYSRRMISARYLDTFSKIAELINSHLGDEDFIINTLDLVINATGAERGAIFIRGERDMEFVAGRNIDKKTIEDANELSKTAIEEIDKNKIVFIPNAVDDPKFNTKKSVLLNRIRSILCIPLVISGHVVGAIYLDSRIIGSIFNEQDRDFLIAISKILATVIEKSIVFKNLRNENILLKTNVLFGIGAGYLISESKKMKKIYQDLDLIAQSDAPVLITGETGTGKGMLARLIHMKSKRREKKFISINCGAIPETLLESELFGHKKGSFTGAYSDKRGLLEEGEGGTIFLDEISNTGPGFQAKILEAIEDKIIRRLGETTTRQIDVRFILASNRNLEEEVEEGRFRQDLYYRINVFKIDVPPLRERVDDIPELAKFFLDKYCRELGRNIKGFAPGVMERLKDYHWQGNIRELENVIERAVTLCRGDIIGFNEIGLGRPKEEILPLKEIEKEVILEALNATGWNKEKAAEKLGISRKTLYNLLKRYSITR